MERNVNYVVIGAIFCVLTIAMIAFIFWIGRFGLDIKKQRIYHIYTQDEIGGISIDTPVKYKGIIVGSVVDIGFKTDEVGTVKIDVAISKKIPIREGSKVVIDSDSFVGMSYLNLKQSESGEFINDDSKALLKLDKNALSRLLGQAEGLGTDVQEILSNVKSITDGKNLEGFLETLNSLQSTKENLDETLTNINKLVKNLDSALSRGDFNFKDLIAPVANNAQNSFYLLNTFLEKISHFFDRLERDPYGTLLGKRD